MVKQRMAGYLAAHRKEISIMRFGLFALCFVAALPLLAAPVDLPETVLVTFHPAAGKADEVEALIWQEWGVTTRLGLVINKEIHHVYRGKSETGETLIFDTFTWRDHATPDNAPQELLDVWRKMNHAVERPNNHPAIEFLEVEERHPPASVTAP
jgi:hypothetical protein